MTEAHLFVIGILLVAVAFCLPGVKQPVAAARA